MADDSTSVKSNDSSSTSSGYEIVKETISEPQLNINNGGDIEDLKQKLSEVLLTSSDEMEHKSHIKKVGVSKFYSDPDTSTEDKTEQGLEEGTVFNGVSYLGSATINAPKSEAEIHRNMEILNQEEAPCIRVSVSVPSCSAGSVILNDASTMQEIARYEVHRILFYAYGTKGSKEEACFAFTWSHGNTQESAIFQCHVFRCDIPEAVSQVTSSFSKAFKRSLNKVSNVTTTESQKMTSDPIVSPSTELFTFEIQMEIKEEDSKGSYSCVPKDRSQFKLRADIQKQICLTLHQASSSKQRTLTIDRCFGVLIAPGKNVPHPDMQLLEMIPTATENGYLITSQWNPSEPALEALNKVDEPSSGTRTYITVAVDLVIKEVQEPVRFVIETAVRIYPKQERFWYFSRKVLTQNFYLNLREIPSQVSQEEPRFDLVSIDTYGEIDRSRNLALNFTSFISATGNFPTFDTLSPKDYSSSDTDEPVLSGTGEVSKDCSESILENWSEVLNKWTQSGSRPRQLNLLVRQGIPESLRGEVWQRLAGCSDDLQIMNNYRLLIARESSCESVILRDISRTFPAHDFFKEVGGLGQDALFKLSKAYSIYDEEVGYCQGLSFLAAALLLHMPEEQAFCVLVKIMYKFQLRDLFKDGFEHLYMRLYQLNRLMEEHVPELWNHFSENGVEAHMFASQWFLTLFTAKFPLYLVYHILDVFLLQGLDTLFQVAIALLLMSKRELLTLDFEGILKYFRVSLPKRCRSPEVSRELMKLACNVKVKRLKKYEQDFIEIKAAQDNAEQCTNELERLKTELQSCEEDKKALESELSQVKLMIQREIQISEADNKRNDAIISEYKQICSQLSKRLEQMNSSKVNDNECVKCRGWIDPLTRTSEIDPKLQAAQQRISELEKELVQTKLAHAESECKNQDLMHKLSAAQAELELSSGSKGSWIHKTISSIRDVANKTKESVPVPSTVITQRKDSLSSQQRPE